MSSVEILEKSDVWRATFDRWRQDHKGGNAELGTNYPFVENQRAPFQPARRALPMLNLALISSAGAYIDGTDAFDTSTIDGDTSWRELPSEVEGRDLCFAARGYDQAAVKSDLNSQIPLQRLAEFQNNGIIGQLNPVWWSFSGFIPSAAKLVDELIPGLIERVTRYEVQAALLVPASHLCHQSIALVARGLELAHIPTMMVGVERSVLDRVRPPRAAFYSGEFGSVAGQPRWPEHQRRVLDESLRWIEPLDQPSVRKLTVDLESEVEKSRGER